LHELLTATAERAIRYLEGLDERGVAPDPAFVARLAELDIPLPTDPSPADETVALLDSYSAATMAIAGPRFFGFVICGALPAALAASWLVSAWDQNAALAEVTPLPAKVEEDTLGWLRDVLGLPPETGVGFVTGATMSNFTCLVAAHHSVFKQTGWDVEADGMCSTPAVTVVVGEEAHPTLFKSLGLADFGRNRVVRVPVDKPTFHLSPVSCSYSFTSFPFWPLPPFPVTVDRSRPATNTLMSQWKLASRSTGRPNPPVTSSETKP
jgi:glutamate/tyrosine decarboxylase-like PLP-dependent enzyme